MAEHDASERWSGIRRRQQMLSVRHEVAARRSQVAKMVEAAGNALADPRFFVTFTIAHIGWIIANLDVIPGISVWDPPPFTILATVTAVEAPIIALLVLMAQQRSRRVQELREEVELQVDLYMERQISTALAALEAIGRQLEVDIDRIGGLRELAEPLDPERVMDTVGEELASDEEGGKTAEE